MLASKKKYWFFNLMILNNLLKFNLISSNQRLLISIIDFWTSTSIWTFDLSVLRILLDQSRLYSISILFFNVKLPTDAKINTLTFRRHYLKDWSSKLNSRKSKYITWPWTEKSIKNRSKGTGLSKTRNWPYKD